MIRALVILAALAAGFTLAVTLRLREPERVYASRMENVMGAPLDIRVAADSPAAARRADAAARAAIGRDTKILSPRDPGSEVSRWLRSSSVVTKISPELSEVLGSFDDWRTRTQGAVEPASGPVRSLWQHAAEQNRVPTPRELQSALVQIHQRHWILDRSTSTATHTSDVPLILGSFSKGYVFDRAARAALAEPGVSGVMLSAGGRAIVRGTWTQPVAVPGDAGDDTAEAATLVVGNAAIAIKSGARRGFDVAGRHYSQIDPRNGQPAGDVLRVAVISANPITADALATAFSVLTPAESVALAATVPDVQFSITLAGGRRIDSPGWRAFEMRPRETPARAGDAPDAVLAARSVSPEGRLFERYL